MTLLDDEEASGINVLPDEILIHIFKYLPLESLLACENVCGRWRKISLDAALWRRIVIVYSGKPGEGDESLRILEIITSHCEYVYCLKLQYIYCYTIIKSLIKKCSRLINLELVMCRLNIEFEDDIKRWPKLKKLNLKNTLLVRGSGDLDIHYNQFKDLNYLGLSDFGLSHINCDTLLHCSRLSHILIEKIKDLSVDFIKKLIRSKRHILVTLHIYGGESVDDSCLQLLSKCKRLKDLAIIRCEKLTDEGLMALKNFKQIEHLQIWNNTNFSEGNLLKTLGSPVLKNLQSLSLSRIGNISPLVVDIISEYYKNLKFLALYQCPKIINTDYEKQLKSKFRNIDVVLY